LKTVQHSCLILTRFCSFGSALDKFHKDIELEMTIFKVFLKELEEMRINKEALGTFTPLMADHMAREETYYLKKIELVS